MYFRSVKPLALPRRTQVSERMSIASFDVIVSSGALHHISRERSDHELAIHEMLRVLKPGGRIALWDVSHMVEGYAAGMKLKGINSDVKKTIQSPFGFEMSVMIGRRDS